MNLPEYLLNVGLNLSMEFGENWLEPINERLSEIYPELTTLELNYCNELCSKINKTAHGFIKNNPKQIGQEFTFIEFIVFEKFMTDRYEWINHSNLNALYSQSCYYSMK